jgi:hypothetical protein
VSPSATSFGPNEPQVLWVRDVLAAFSLDDWSALEAASEGPFAPQREKVYDAVADVIGRHAGKPWWEAVKMEARAISEVAAADYDRAHSISHSLSSSTTIRTWTGETEVETKYELAPSKSHGFRVAAEDALAVVMIRPFGTPEGWLQLWEPLEPVVHLLEAERDGGAPAVGLSDATSRHE